MRFKTIEYILLCFLFLSCEDNVEETKYKSVPITEDYSHIEDPFERWQAYGLVDYVIEQERGCFCFDVQFYKYIIKNKEIIEVLNLDNEETDEDSIGLTVEALFELSNSLDSTNIDYYFVNYDSTFGYPSFIYIDPESGLADEEYFYSTRNLEKLVQ